MNLIIAGKINNPEQNATKTAVIIKLAQSLGLQIFELTSEDPFQEIKAAIKLALGVEYEQYVSPSRKSELYYARLIYIHQAHKSHRVSDLVELTNRTKNTINRSLHMYENELKYNPEFSKIVSRVENVLSIMYHTNTK